MQDENLDELVHKIEIFMEHGLVMLGVVFFLVGFCLAIPKIVTVSTSYTEDSLPIYRVKTDKKLLALTFDSAWGNEDFKEILSILKQEDVKATFFFSGHFIDTYKEEIKLCAKEGHDIANHGYHHTNYSNLTKKEITKEILQADDKLYEITGKKSTLFRPPSGDYNKTVIDAARDCGYTAIQWDVDSLDWKNYGKSDIISKVIHNKNLNAGSIILLHNGTKYTKEALLELIRSLKNMGYQLVPVSELIYTNDYYIDHTGCQIKK